MQRFDKKALMASTKSAHVSEIAVQFQDVDAAGIVFFSRVFEYVHRAYVDFLDFAGCPLAAVIEEKRWAAPLRHAEADYLAPARFGDVVRVALVAASVEATEVSLGWALRFWDDRDGFVAVAQTVHTFVEVSSFRRRPVPDEIVRALRIFTP
jgi:1,4-dihydroxy-2-naphthoyl-CoA hydrolase